MSAEPGTGLRVPRWALFGVMAVIVTAIAVGWVNSERRLAEEAARYMLVEEFRTSVASEPLRACLDEIGANALALQERWGSPKGLPQTQRKRNPERSIQIDVVDRGNYRLVRFSAQNARPLYPSEQAVLDRCIAA